MRILCGLGVALLVSGGLWAQHHGGSSPGHSGTPSYGARPSGSHGWQHFHGRGTPVWTPYAYAVPYYYGAPDYGAPPPEQPYTDSGEPAPADAGPGGPPPSPQYAEAEPPPHSVIINIPDAEEAPPPEPAHYYVALKDHHVYLAVAYWVQGDTLHYFLPGNTHNQVSLSLVDRDLMDRLNRESGVVVRLPGK